MGLFDRSNKVPRRQIRTMHVERPNDHADLHYKAKSKLIGAIVLAAVGAIVLPFFLSSDELAQPTGTSDKAPLIAPGTQADNSVNSGAIAVLTAPNLNESSTQASGTGVLPHAVHTPHPEGETSVTGTIDSRALTESTDIPQSIARSVGEASHEAPITTSQPVPETVEKNTPVKPVKSLNSKTGVAAAEATKPPLHEVEVKRTDDGSVARALLEGKTPATAAGTHKANNRFPAPQSSAQPAKNPLTVQVAAFSSMGDARAQRERLSASGVSNVFIQAAVVNGRQTYRLRVGPFNSQESAQAALTRLRGLGYDGFITGNGS